MPESPRLLPLKVLAALTAVVLLVHLAVLQGSVMTLGLSQPAPTRAFTTRAVELVPAGPTSAEPSSPPPVATPRQRATPSPAKTKTPAPRDREAGSSAVAPPPPTSLGQEDNSSPSQTATTPAVTRPDEGPAEADQLAAAQRPSRNELASVTAYTLPGSVRLKYQVTANKFPFSLNSELLWQQNGATYEARLEFSAFGQARVQTSRGQITPQGLAPLRFSDRFRSEVAAHFDRAKGKVTFSANTPDVPLLSGAQDRLSILVQLGAMIAGDPGHYPQATTIALQTIGPRDADTWRFTVGQQETLTLPGGPQLTLKLVRNPRQEFDQRVEVWLAPALGYLPARIRITESNGDFIDQKWQATEPQS